jgi:hypothetical protein
VWHVSPLRFTGLSNREPSPCVVVSSGLGVGSCLVSVHVCCSSPICTHLSAAFKQNCSLPRTTLCVTLIMQTLLQKQNVLAAGQHHRGVAACSRTPSSGRRVTRAAAAYGDADEEHSASARPSYSAKKLYNLLGSAKEPVGSERGEVGAYLAAAVLSTTCCPCA